MAASDTPSQPQMIACEFVQIQSLQRCLTQSTIHEHDLLLKLSIFREYVQPQLDAAGEKVTS